MIPKIYLLFFICCCSMLSCTKKQEDPYIFFLHNRFLEINDLQDEHPKFGTCEYQAILKALEDNGNVKVISEKRGETNVRDYAKKLTAQIDSLIAKGVHPSHITIVGTSKGGYIAQYVSTFANNPELNFVFIASFMDSDIQEFPDINYCGNILTIYEKSDPYGTSTLKRKETSKCSLNYFKEVELNTGLGHGFIFKPMDEWIKPTIEWAKNNYKVQNAGKI